MFESIIKLSFFFLVIGFMLADGIAQGQSTLDTKGRIRVRAREHFERINIQTDEDLIPYSGFTNTINLWWEVPFSYQVGFAGSPLLAKLYTKDPPVGFSDAITLIHLGIEAKFFPLPKGLPIFLRLGFYDTTLDTRSETDKLKGSSELFGAGWEFNFSGIGVAPEMAWRYGILEQSVRFQGTAPAIGVHFYKLL